MSIVTESRQVATTDGLRRLLLVDDEPNILQSLKRLLRRKDLTIYTASNAKEALEILDVESIQVMLTDHKMPDITGAELIDKVRLQYPDVVSIMLSGQADFEQVIRLLNDKAAMRFIKKPWRNEEVVGAIEHAFKHYNQSTYGSWQKRVNRLLTCIESESFEETFNRYKSRSQSSYVAAIQYVNIAELARVLGQQSCEQIQADLINETSKLLPDLAEFFYYEAGLLLIVLPSMHNEVQVKAMLDHVMFKMIEKISHLSKSVRLELKAAFLLVESFDTSPELLIEQLKASMQSADSQQQLIQLDAELQSKLNRQQQIKGAIAPELDSGQFKLVVQPKVSLGNHLIESAEILLRWQHSTLGWISPMEFIRLAELDGQINRVGNWVLEHGIRLISRLTRFSPDIKSVSINVSARQLYQQDFTEQLELLLKKYSLAPSYLELEITETCIAEDANFIQSILWRIKLLGVSISIDDFGSGGTAYSFLTNLPIDVLKLDKCLIDGLVYSSSKRKLVKSLIDICHSLAIEVVAEGAEDTQTVEILESLKCNKVQGFIFSKALPPEEFEKLLIRQPFIQNRSKNIDN